MATHGSEKLLDDCTCLLENQDERISSRSRIAIGQALKRIRRAATLPNSTLDMQHPWWFVFLLIYDWWLLMKKWCVGILGKVGQAFNRKAQPLQNLYSETLHPWLLRVIRGLKDAGYMCLVGIEKLAPICIAIAVIIPHCLLLPFWYLYLFKDLPSHADGKIPLNTLIHQASFVFISLLLAVIFYILDNRLKKSDPEADLIKFCLEYVPQLPPGLRIICGTAAYFTLSVGYVILYSIFFLGCLYIFLLSSRLFGLLRMLSTLIYSISMSHFLEVLEKMKVRRK